MTISYRLSLGNYGSSKLYLSVCLFVCPDFSAYISVAMRLVLMKPCGSVRN